MNKYISHFKTITTHKWHVFNACRKSGLLWRGIKHDLSKYSPIEFFTSAKYFTGTSSPIDAEKRKFGYSKAWAHHKGRNSNHWEYWTDWENGKLYAMKMPLNDIKELICDYVGAGKAYNKSKWDTNTPLQYYGKIRNNIVMHDESRKIFEFLLVEFSNMEEDDFYIYLKNFNPKY